MKLSIVVKQRLILYLQAVSSYPALVPGPYDWKGAARPPPPSNLMVIGATDNAGRIYSRVERVTDTERSLSYAESRSELQGILGTVDRTRCEHHDCRLQKGSQGKEVGNLVW